MSIPPVITGQLPMLYDICNEFEVKELALFGSALTERFAPESDLDLLVEFKPKARVGLFRFLGLQNRLAELFHRKVDLVPKNTLKPFLRERVLKQAEIIYAG